MSWQTLGIRWGLQSVSYLGVNIAVASAVGEYSWGKGEMGDQNSKAEL